ncbi:MAG: glycine betaine ABC transporter substrate-binding protein [Breznakia sp.]
MDFLNYMVENQSQIFSLLLDHIQLTFLAVGMAILIGVPVGILICYVSRLKKGVLGFANLIQAIPSMALLGFAIPLLGIGNLPAVVIVTLYSLLPIIKNTVTGISNINKQTIEAARGIGLTKLQILYKVEIPLALPVIMAGVRISAVTGVGLMTMAAFIGGDGLGYLVFSGIRTVNNNQILAGALPACILALTIDYFGGVVEYLLTPRALLPNLNKESEKKKRFRQKMVLIIACAALVVSVVVANMGGSTQSVRQLKIGSKDYTEQIVLLELASQLIEENSDIQVVRKENLGGTQVALGAIKNKDIDMYMEYSGTAFGDVLGHEMSTDVEYVYETVVKEYKEKFDIQVLKQMNFNNTYTLAVSQETATKYNLKTFSDLQKVANELTLGATLEFLNREDGLLGLQSKHAMNFKEVKGIDSSSRYIALNSGESDVVDAFATDGLLKKFNLVVLEDDYDFFPPYYAMPIITQEAYDEFPEIIPLLESLGSKLDEETMINLNYKVDEEQQTPKAVAREFLLEEGLIK